MIRKDWCCVLVYINLAACKSDPNSRTTRQDVETVIESDSILDQCKWLIYSLNYESGVHCQNSSALNNITVVSMPIHIIGKFVYKDKVAYDFVIKDSILDCEANMVFRSVVVKKNGIKYPISPQIDFGLQNNDDSCMNFNNRANDNFTVFLRNYKGKINSWLQLEAQKRGVLLH